MDEVGKFPFDSPERDSVPSKDSSSSESALVLPATAAFAGMITSNRQKKKELASSRPGLRSFDRFGNLHLLRPNGVVLQ
jgi:hypothetical protein